MSDATVGHGLVVVDESAPIGIPFTGEIVSRDDPASIARAYVGIADMERMLKSAKTLLLEAAIEEGRRQGARTMNVDGWKLELGQDSELAWDLDALAELREAGLPQARYDDLVKQEVSYKVVATVADQISRANPDYAAIIDRARQRNPKRPTLKVTQPRPAASNE